MTHVTEIKLPSNGLTGPIPKEIGFLPYLTKLDLADNEIVGTIPEEIYNLQNLR
jgi:Leucine-rich repeat (LRR) protein